MTVKEALDLLIKNPTIGIKQIYEPVIAQDAEASYVYALSIQNRFELGEPVISKDPKWAFFYADRVIKNVWKDGEDAISKDATYSYHYTMNLLNKNIPHGRRKMCILHRFHKAEPTLAKKPSVAIRYAEDVLKSRFILAEPNILKSNPKTILRYYMAFQKEFPNKIWEEAEKNISQDLMTFSSLVLDIKKEKSEVLEQKILSEPENKRCPKYIFDYCSKILKNRWKEAEHIVFKNVKYGPKYALKFDININEENHNKLVCELAFGSVSNQNKKLSKKYFEKTESNKKLIKRYIEDLIKNNSISKQSSIEDLLIKLC